MPVYSYKCPSCEHVEERLVRFADRDSQRCRRIVSTTLEDPEISYDGTIDQDCGELLERELSLNAKMSSSWSKW